MRSQHIHTMGARQVSQITDWLFNLINEEIDGVPVHFIQSLQIVNCHQPYITSAGFMAVVVCNHDERVYVDVLVQEMAEVPMSGEEDDHATGT